MSMPNSNDRPTPGEPASQHKAHAPRVVRIFGLTVSDTRTPDNDEGGRLIRERIAAAGHTLTGHAIVKDDPEAVREVIRRLVAERGADVLITTGGTGISGRDNTYEAVAGLLDKRDRMALTPEESEETDLALRRAVLRRAPEVFA